MPERIDIKKKNLKLLAAIHAAGYSNVRECADGIGIGYNNLLRYLSRQARPQRKVAQKLAKGLGVDVKDLDF